MKSLVVYSSQTGNTQKLAQAVYETLSGEKEISSIADAPDPDGYDFIAIGFWLQAGKPDPRASEYFSKIITNKRLFLFATHGAAPGSDHVKNAMTYARGLVSNADRIDTFSCLGEVNPGVLEKIKAKPEPPVWAANAGEAIGHPDDADIIEIKQVITSLFL